MARRPAEGCRPERKTVVRIRKFLYRGIVVAVLAAAGLGVAAGAAEASPACVGYASQARYYWALAVAYVDIAHDAFVEGDYDTADWAARQADRYDADGNDYINRWNKCNSQEP
jgi:hypothetical protein